MQFNDLLQSGTKEEILKALEVKLVTSNEAKIWTEKAIPFTSSILSVLLPLREQNLLITPEGRVVSHLDSTLFYKWCDLVSLKTLAFRIETSNQISMLVDSSYSQSDAEKYELIDLEELATYLLTCKVDLEDFDKNFPIAQYNVHKGVTQVIKELMEL